MTNTKAKAFGLKINAKNTVFANLFSDSKYLLMLYKGLHPEDIAAEESDLRIALLQEDFSNDVCTDFCFRVRGDRFIVLAVMQSTLNYNALWRMFFLFIVYLGRIS